MKRYNEQGFTVIELIAVIVLIGAAALLFFVQKSNVQVAALDDKRKTAINAIYYNLEEVYFTKYQYYPAKLNAKDLPAMDPELFKDTQGVDINDQEQVSEYHYEPLNCTTDGKCRGYTLRVDLQSEDDFVKKSRHN